MQCSNVVVIVASLLNKNEKMDHDNRDESQDTLRNFVLPEIIIDGILDPLNESQNLKNAEIAQPTEFSVELFSGSPLFTN
ncbi:hypothetical protein F8M41_021876 [Gigaspora margarita]|uniref:Uncharacterized protein n=1 Tax=Gigaspora margarita TaxID=4874 RepID=A0A8H4EIF6_GIGMA|nr:hypothetical protein F8M41_021876 [Gigaspora margarita]